MNLAITGVTRGFGRALAEWFIAHGHTVAGCGRNEHAIRQMGMSHPEPHSFEAVDVSQASRVDSWARRVLGGMGAPDLLVNNAALMNAAAPLWRVPSEEFARIVSVNIVGVANVIRAFVPAMVDLRKGVIVNISSGWGQTVSPNVAPYCATKWAIEGLTKALAEELPPGMAAVPLSPGVINTDMLRIAWPEGAASQPKPEAWVEVAAPFILRLGPAENGKSMRVRA
jgi:NAD(P)-dependent dehydrogenase (short-subunit alcohol dehydrogenase family)